MKKQSKFLAMLLALAMMVSLLSVSAFAAMDNDHDRISVSTEGGLSVSWSTSNYSSGAIVSESSTLYPSTFVLFVDDASSIVVSAGSYEEMYDTEGGTAYQVSTTGAGTITITLNSPATAPGVYTLSYQASQGTAPGGTNPTSVVSYLPIGQYANGANWGSSAGKFTSGLASTGVSLGAFGGYIEFYFEDAIENNAKNPYGVDFLVYGNAFDGNPEAGAVQVSSDGETWYELAGSLYYANAFSYTGNQGAANKFSTAYTGTLRDATVTYNKNDSNITVTLKDAANATKVNNEVFCPAVAWWPLVSEGYPMGAIPSGLTNIGISHSDSQLTFSGVTAVQDSNATAFYAFGYADVTPNGSNSNYGTAVKNPYTAYTKGMNGGDGFDLDWAVDIETGEPVTVSDIHYVRVYTATLDNGTFGETSTEVCGICVANSNSSAVGVTDAPILVNPTTGAIHTAVRGGITPAGAGTYLLTSTADNVFVNGVRVNASSGYTLNVASGSIYQIIVQSGTAQPYITWVK